MKALLDTHILLWWFTSEERLSKGQRQVIRKARPDAPLLVADISLWEIAVLNELGRIQLALPLREWLERATAPPLVQLCSITPAIASQVADLPATFHRDPADRIIVSTARVLGAELLTSDDRILRSGIVSTIN